MENEDLFPLAFLIRREECNTPPKIVEGCFAI
jgi:hypothetical protein